MGLSILGATATRVSSITQGSGFEGNLTSSVTSNVSSRTTSLLSNTNPWLFAGGVTLLAGLPYVARKMVAGTRKKWYEYQKNTLRSTIDSQLAELEGILVKEQFHYRTINDESSAVHTQILPCLAKLASALKECSDREYCAKVAMKWCSTVRPTFGELSPLNHLVSDVLRIASVEQKKSFDDIEQKLNQSGLLGIVDQYNRKIRDFENSIANAKKSGCYNGFANHVRELVDSTTAQSDFPTEYQKELFSYLSEKHKFLLFDIVENMSWNDIERTHILVNLKKLGLKINELAGAERQNQTVLYMLAQQKNYSAHKKIQVLLNTYFTDNWHQKPKTKRHINWYHNNLLESGTLPRELIETNTLTPPVVYEPFTLDWAKDKARKFRAWLSGNGNRKGFLCALLSGLLVITSVTLATVVTNPVLSLLAAFWTTAGAVGCATGSIYFFFSEKITGAISGFLVSIFEGIAKLVHLSVKGGVSEAVADAGPRVINYGVNQVKEAPINATKKIAAKTANLVTSPINFFFRYSNESGSNSSRTADPSKFTP